MDDTGTAASKRDAAVVKVGAANAAATLVAEAEGATVKDEELVVTAAPEGVSVARPAEAEAENTAPEDADGVATDDRSTTGTKTGADRAGDTLAEARKPAEPEGEPRSS